MLDWLFELSKTDGGIDREIIRYSFINNPTSEGLFLDLRKEYLDNVHLDDQKFRELVAP